MRVAFLAPLPPPRTGQSLCDLAVLEYLERDAEVVVIPTSKGELRQGVGSIAHVGSTLRQVVRILTAARSTRSANADVTYMSPSQTVVGHFKDLLLLTVLGARGRSRVVLHLHGGGFASVLNGPWAPLTRRLFGRVGAAIVLGPSLRGQLDGVISPERIVDVANFAAQELFVAEESIEETVRRTPLSVLLIGSLFTSKGYPAVIEAARRAAHEAIDVRFTIAGPAPRPEDLEAVHDAVNQLDNLTYLGELAGDERAAALADHAMVVVPTRYPWEGQPLVVLEAYASGCVVAATDHAGIGDVFTAGVNGPQLTGTAVDELAKSTLDAVRTVSADTEAALGIARSNRALAENYRQERFAAEVSAVIASVASV